METLIQDVRYGLRMLRRNPGFGITVVLILAIGVGANSAVFSVVNAILLKPLPYANSDRLVMLRDTGDQGAKTPMSYPEFQAWREHKNIFESVGAYFPGSIALTSPGEPQQFDVVHVSTELLPTLGVQLRKGRTFTAQEELAAGPPAVIISDSFWHNRLHDDPNALDSALTLDSKSYTVVGILPPDFHLANDPDLLLPLRLNAELAPAHYNFLRVIGKTHANDTLQRVRTAALTAVKSVNDMASSTDGTTLSVVSLQEFLVGDSRPLLLALLGTVALVLLIACANTANLLLARAAAREKEIAIRMSLGSGRLRLIRQLLTESLLLSLIGGVLGLLFAHWGLGALITLLGDKLPHATEIHLDASVFQFTALISLVTGILFGLAPALQAAKQNLVDRLKMGGRLSGGVSQAQVIRNGLIVLEIAFSLVLLAGTGLLLRSFIRLANVDKGFDADHVLTMHIAVNPTQYSDPKRAMSYLEQIVRNTRNLPGVESAGFISNLPFSGNSVSGDFQIQGVAFDPNHLSNASKEFVVGDYFKVMHLPLIKGRLLNETDTAQSRPVVVVDQSFVRQYFPNQDALGKRIDVGWGKSGWSEIVGVVGEAREFAMTSAPIPTIYSPMEQKPDLLEFLAFDLAVRTQVNPEAQIQAVSNQIHQLDGTQVISKVQTMDTLIDSKLASRRDPMWIFACFSIAAVLLASIGIYGVLSYYVLQRTSEIGTRLALGAQRSDILKNIVGHALKLVTAGVVLGLGVSIAIAHLLTSLLFGVQSTDMPTFIAVSILLAALALMACAVPAIRATRVDPLIVLRNE
ncbi:MAG TPA: ABC transporter permease [Candidatus Angelobacter sp.]